MDTEPLKALLSFNNLAMSGLLVLVVLSGFAVSYTSYENRRLYNAMQQEQENKNSVQVEWGQLLLEHSTLTSPGYIEKLAREQLNMEVPPAQNIEMVLP